LRNKALQQSFNIALEQLKISRKKEFGLSSEKTPKGTKTLTGTPGTGGGGTLLKHQRTHAGGITCMNLANRSVKYDNESIAAWL